MPAEDVDSIVAGMDRETLEKLAARQLNGMDKPLLDIITYIGETRLKTQTASYENQLYEELIQVGIKRYDRKKAEMQRYGIWKNRYEQVFQKAQRKGEVDINLFFGLD